MNRRNFLLLSSLSIALSQVSLAKDISTQNLLVLEKVYDILFPQTKQMPSASQFGVINYLKQNIYHETFNKEDAHLITQGATDFFNTFPDFLNSSMPQQEQMIQKALQSDYGHNWLSTLLHYGLEAMLSDPIYGGNTQQIAWQALEHKPGLPQPTVTYARRV